MIGGLDKEFLMFFEELQHKMKAACGVMREAELGRQHIAGSCSVIAGSQGCASCQGRGRGEQ